MAQVSPRSVKPILEQLGASLSAALSDERLSITGVAYDSRAVRPGDAFFCLPGEHVDGNAFIAEALKNGAACVVTEHRLHDPKLPFAVVGDVREALAAVAAWFYDYPSSRLRLLAVTGTNGKTTTTHLVERIFQDAGFKTGLIGTLGTRMEASQRYTDVKHTTPQAADLQRTLAAMLEAGCRYVAIEVSSHALAQKRVAQTQFSTAVLTNVTQDHLDFHKTMDNYWRSKRLLFESLSCGNNENRTAVLNLDDPLYEQFAQAVKPPVRLISYGWSAPAAVHVKQCSFTGGGTQLLLATPDGDLELELRLSGKFNVYNVMAAVGVACAERLSLSAVKASLESFKGVAGRFEVVALTPGQEPLCIVDYAHTPDGLQNVLKAAAPLVGTGGKLIVVFGCGGDRDASKRPQMGEIAEALADEVVVTSDNPRSEDPELIIANILTGIKRMHNVKVEADRAAAIRLAVLHAAAHDVVVVAGKGHEDYQILADRTIPFDDRQQVLAALKLRPAAAV